MIEAGTRLLKMADPNGLQDTVRICLLKRKTKILRYS